MICKHKGCRNQASKGKVFCNKHLHGQTKTKGYKGSTKYSTISTSKKKSS